MSQTETRVGSLFAGIGGFDLAAERAGMTVAWQSEIDKHASRVLAHHWPDVPNLGDVHDVGDAPAVDVLTGGFPCQDYSVAGKRGGLAGDRGALWWEYHRLITGLRPTWVVGENVPGLLSSRGGADFETIVGSLTECGYGVAWAVLDAQYFGVAQRRRRVFIVGHSGGVPRPEVLALSEGVFGHPEARREEGQGATTSLTQGLGTGGPDFAHAAAGWLVESGTHLGVKRGDVGVTGVVLDGGAQHPCDELKVGACECVHPHEHTLSAPDVNAPIVFESSRRDGVRLQDDQSPTLQAQMGTGGLNTPMVAFAQNQRDELRRLVVASSLNAARWSTAKNETLLAEPPTVRRLTPLECERLQGFPDGWTDIEGNSDTQRYRQLGNAVAVPVAEWILERIVEAS